MNKSALNHEEDQRDLERRGFLKVLGGAVGWAMIPNTALSDKARQQRPTRRHRHRTPPQQFTAADTLTKFVDALPIPKVMSPNGTYRGAPLYDVNMEQFRQRLHRDLPPTTLWSYNGQFPNPTFEVRRGSPIAVRWRNSLPDTHFLPIDHTIHGAETSLPEVRTVVHLHGIKVLPESDGYPEAWFTRGFGQTGPFFANRIYQYPNDQEATTLWYHDHALGITRLNVYAGLSGGLYLIRDTNEDSLDLPADSYEIPLVIQDRFFDLDGSLRYPVQTPGDPDQRVPPLWIPEFFGDTIMVNGKIWPFLEVEPRKYRFRILNASNARFYHLTLARSADGGQQLGGPVPQFIQIGSDGGFLPAPVRLTELLLAPAERLDVIIDFSNFENETFLMANDAKAPFPDGDDLVPSDVMLFKVNQRRRGRDPSRVPAILNHIPLLNPATAVKVRDMVLTELDSAAENPIMAMIDDSHWDDPVIQNPTAGTTEVWRIINLTGDAHPIHIHLVQFQILDRQPFDTEQYPQNLVFTGPPIRPGRNERPAWKDTVISYPGTVTRIIAKFSLPAGTRIEPGEKFRYVFHCHIMEHEENEMMRPYDVVG